jgi:hypothetical protein
MKTSRWSRRDSRDRSIWRRCINMINISKIWNLPNHHRRRNTNFRTRFSQRKVHSLDRHLTYLCTAWLTPTKEFHCLLNTTKNKWKNWNKPFKVSETKEQRVQTSGKKNSLLFLFLGLKKLGIHLWMYMKKRVVSHQTTKLISLPIILIGNMIRIKTGWRKRRGCQRWKTAIKKHWITYLGWGIGETIVNRCLLILCQKSLAKRKWVKSKKLI